MAMLQKVGEQLSILHAVVGKTKTNMGRKRYDIEIVTQKSPGKFRDTFRDLMIIVVILSVMDTETSERETITVGITIDENRKMESMLSQSQTAIRGNIPATIRHTVIVFITAIVVEIMIIVIVIAIVIAIAIVIVIVIVNELIVVHFRDGIWNQAKIS